MLAILLFPHILSLRKSGELLKARKIFYNYNISMIHLSDIIKKMQAINKISVLRMVCV